MELHTVEEMREAKNRLTKTVHEGPSQSTAWTGQENVITRGQEFNADRTAKVKYANKACSLFQHLCHRVRLGEHWHAHCNGLSRLSTQWDLG